MDLSLYAIVAESARYCRDPVIRFRIHVFLKAIKEQDIQKACAHFGISRNTYYRWWRRFFKSGFNPVSLEDQSCRPHQMPRQTPAKVIRKIRYYRKQYHYGPERIAYYLKENHQIILHRSSIARIIQREGLILKKYRTKKINPHKKRYELPWPGQMIQLDIKYVPYRVQGKKLYAFNAIDDCTRWRFSRLYEDKSLKSCLDFVKDLIRYAPFTIRIIQTDNDRVFTNRFSAWANYDLESHEFTQTLKRYQIKHRLIPPGAKELNGKVERSHRIDDEEFYWKAPRISVSTIKQAYTQWIWEYNHDRPHSSLGGQTPMKKLLEKTLVEICFFALRCGLDPEKIFVWDLKPKQKLTTTDAYLKYLHYLQSDYRPVSEVLSYYMRKTL